MDATSQPIPLAQPKPKPLDDPKTQLHSILKKPNTIQPEHHKTTRLLLERPDGTNVLRSPRTPPSPNPEEAAEKGDTDDQKRTPKKPYFPLLRAARNAHRRPVIHRRKTTQTTVPRAHSPPPPRRNQSHPNIPIKTSDVDAFTQQLSQEMESSDEDVTNSGADSSFDTLAPLSRQSTAASTPPQTSSFIDALRESRRPFIHPLVNSPTENRDSASLKEAKKISAVPQPFTNDDGRREIEYHSPPTIQRTYYTVQPEGTPVPGFTNAKRIPMPETMIDDLVSIIANPHPVQGEITIPSRPWIRSENIWYKPSGEQPLHDWMIRDENLPQNPQPGKKPLVEKGFRTRFAQMQIEIAAETAEEEMALVRRRKGKKSRRKVKWGHEKLGSSAPVEYSSDRAVDISRHTA